MLQELEISGPCIICYLLNHGVIIIITLLKSSFDNNKLPIMHIETTLCMQCSEFFLLCAGSTLLFAFLYVLEKLNFCCIQ